jgi:hypothetical protein
MWEVKLVDANRMLVYLVPEKGRGLAAPREGLILLRTYNAA